MRKFKSFTLIELLVVIVVIVILISMLLPSLSRAKEKARIVGCSNNLRQITVALSLYLKNNKQKLPWYKGSCVSWIGPVGDSQNASWTEKPLNVYFKDKSYSVTKCPSKKKNYWEDWGTNYYNNTLWSSNTLGDSVKFITEVNDPSRMITLYEDGLWWWVYSNNTQTWGTFNKDLLYHRQRAGKFNSAFVDGSIRTMMEFDPNKDSGADYTFDNLK